jgi:hypothetical protein
MVIAMKSDEQARDKTAETWTLNLRFRRELFSRKVTLFHRSWQRVWRIRRS